MGMFDEVKCDAPLPDNRAIPGSWFQSKSLACCLWRYTITKNGRLIFHRHHYENGPDREIREGLRMPTYKLIKVDHIDTEFHGDVRLYGSADDDTELDYVARFTHGRLEWLRRFEDVSATNENWLLARDV
jgi:hypothetical protein